MTQTKLFHVDLDSGKRHFVIGVDLADVEQFIKGEDFGEILSTHDISRQFNITSNAHKVLARKE